jgi:hypothetical protein
LQARAPIGQFISIWYGEDEDDTAVTDDEKSKRALEARAPIGQFISIWYGEDGDDAATKKRSASIKKRAPDVQVRSFSWCWAPEFVADI